MLQDRVNHLLPERTGAAGEPTLEAELRATIAGEVRFDDGSRALYATDASNYRQVPIGVVIPKSIDDVITTVAACRRRGVPVLPRGGGTSLCGQCCNVAVVIDFTKYLNRIVEIDPQRRIARVLPGVILDDLRDAANAHGLTFAPDPATHNHCSLGGMLGNNSCGPHSVMAGTASDNVVALDVLTYDGERMTLSKHDADADALQRDDGPKARILRELRALGERYAPQIRERYPDIPRRVSGYNIDALLPERFDPARALVGSEGTCVVILEATVRLVPWPNARTLLVLGYPDVYAAGDHVPQIMKAEPIALEGIDDRLVDDMDRLGMHPEKRKLLPEGRGWLLVEFGGDDADEANAKARALMQRLEAQDDAPTMTLCSDPAQQADVWKIRESGLGATAHVPNEPVTWEGWEDSAVPPERLGEYLRALRALLDRYGYGCDLYGHFGQGCVHTRIDFDLQTAEGIAKFRRFIDDAAHLVVNFGGSISGEHGDGQSKASLLPIMFGNELMQAFRDFKRIWDPGNKMNPGKVIDAYEPDENLRLGLDYRPQVLETRLHYLQDGGDFAHTMLRCVGVGECRKKSGTMCPSYMATGEEKHSTRGRARMLWEMVNGNRPDGVLRDGWKEHAVKEALDLCLSCKGCKTECPVSVDMAAYKAEFFSHYYEGRPRPLAAYAFGLIDRWAQLGSVAPQLANLFTQTEPFASIAKAVIGVAPERRITRFAREPFTRW
ncbi:MAG TPA: FAD-linked oxidase C-terminal domain-containing protein, partial [Burkholderiaceae bacterium]|nr:FAD-linked oxidase C-terminal domain-containing protein [Burkholderiaceae bacterium]